jgi:hypothetical protein
MSPLSAVGVGQVQAILDRATKKVPPDTWPGPDMRLIGDYRVSPPSLNEDALPAGWEEWIGLEAKARAVPRDYLAAGLIGAASAWIGNARRVRATPTWIEPAHLWFALIGAPSTGKTPALQPLIEASHILERDAEPAWRDSCRTYERDAEAARARDKAWRDSVRSAAKSNKAEAGGHSEKTADSRNAQDDHECDSPMRPTDAEQPTPPPRPRVVTMDSSTEELQQLLAECPRGLFHVRDELAGWLGSFNRYGGNGADRAFYLECWNGGAYVCDRVRYHGSPVRIEHASLAAIGGMVPDRLARRLRRFG